VRERREGAVGGEAQAPPLFDAPPQAPLPPGHASDAACAFEKIVYVSRPDGSQSTAVWRESVPNPALSLLGLPSK
jgi:hypothetical protein